MGTNYYWRFRVCAHCGRYEQAHVCKLFVGRLSSNPEQVWRAWPDGTSPFGFPVVAIDDWRQVFTEITGELWDEYGRRVDDDPIAWLENCRPADSWRLEKSSTEWFDYGGYRFDSVEFS